MNTFTSQFAFSLAIVLALVLPSSRLNAQSSPASVSKEAALRNISEKVIAPRYLELAAKCRELTNAVKGLAQTPNQSSLDKARQTWLGVAESAGRIRCFQAGPIVEHDYSPLFYYWAILPSRVEAVLNSERPLNLSYLDELGATVKGLFALEYLLFDGRGDPTSELNTNTNALESLIRSERRRTFLTILAHDLSVKAAELGADWTASGPQSASGKFTAAGQASVNLLVNQLARSIEEATERQLNFVLSLPPPVSRQLNRIECARSRSSLQAVIASLDGAKSLYQGAEGLGLDDLLERLNAPLKTRVEEQFAAAIGAVQAIRVPLEEAVVNNGQLVQAAFEKAHGLELLFKVDVASALGVTLTFSLTDGD